MNEKAGWMCRVLDPDKRDRMPLDQRRAQVHAENEKSAKLQAAKVLMLYDANAQDRPIKRLNPEDIECMPLEAWERGERWPTDLPHSAPG